MGRTVMTSLLVCVLLGMPARAAAQPAVGELVERVSGAPGTGRVETAVAASALVFAPPVEGVVLARADDYADALAGAPLAAHVGGPLLLTGRDGLAEATAAEIRRLDPRTVYLLGGEGALSAVVERAVRDLGVEVVRIGGADRFNTARLVAAYLPAGGVAYIAAGAHPDPGHGWPDAVAVSELAAMQARPVLPVTANRLPAETRAALLERGIAEAVVVGGTAAVGFWVEQEIAALGIAVRRVGGMNRYATSALLADEAVGAGADPARTWLTTGRTFADALAAGASAAGEGGVLVLADLRDLDGSPDAAEWLATHRDDFEHVRVLGGGGVAPVETLTQIRARADPSARLLRVRATLEVRDATRPPPFTVEITDPGTMWNHGRGTFNVAFTGTRGDATIADPSFADVLQESGQQGGRLAIAGRRCAPNYEPQVPVAHVICTLDPPPVRVLQGRTTSLTARLHAEPERVGPGRLQPGTYNFEQQIIWSEGYQRPPTAEDPDGRARIQTS